MAHTPQNGPNASVHQHPGAPARPAVTPLVDIHGLRASGIFPANRLPCIRTLRVWTKRRTIPSHRVGGLVFYDVAEVERHIRTKLLVPAR